MDGWSEDEQQGQTCVEVPPAARVLVADDDDDIRDLLVHNLVAEGYDVTACDNGEDARDLARTMAFDAIVLDVMMPKRDGFDVLASLKANPSTRNTPVVLLSAKASDADVWQGWRAGADYYVTKPFNLDELVRFIDQAVDHTARSRG
jgi:two-component system phosphate regulon response regulator OmpR